MLIKAATNSSPEMLMRWDCIGGPRGLLCELLSKYNRWAESTRPPCTHPPAIIRNAEGTWDGSCPFSHRVIKLMNGSVQIKLCHRKGMIGMVYVYPHTAYICLQTGSSVWKCAQLFLHPRSCGDYVKIMWWVINLLISLYAMAFLMILIILSFSDGICLSFKKKGFIISLLEMWGHLLDQ